MLDSHNTINILLVEDDDGDAKAIRRAFDAAKIANPIIRAIDGIDALEILRKEKSNTTIKHPCILLVDINMPRMNGIELVQEMRKDEKLKQLIVFMLTTSKRDEDKIAAYNLNVSGYILKQNAGDDFLKLVNLVDSYWRLVEFPDKI